MAKRKATRQHAGVPARRGSHAEHAQGETRSFQRIPSRSPFFCLLAKARRRCSKRNSARWPVPRAKKMLPSLRLARCVDTPGALLLHEVWASRDAHTEHTHTRHFLRWSAQRRVNRVSRRQLLEADCLRLIARSAFWSSEVVAGPCADFQVFRVAADDIHFNFVVAGGIRATWGIADGVLRVQLAADFVDGFFDGAVLERGEVGAAGAVAATSSAWSFT